MNPEFLTSYFVFASLIFWPLVVMIRRTGLNPAVSIVVFMPVMGLALVASYLCFVKWPVLSGQKEAG